MKCSVGNAHSIKKIRCPDNFCCSSYGLCGDNKSFCLTNRNKDENTQGIKKRYVYE